MIMAYNEEMTNKVREALAHIPNVTETKMFRGVLFMVNGKMCISTGDDEMMCRIAHDKHEEALKINGCRTTVMKGREFKGYVNVHEDTLKSKDHFDYFIKLALDFNQFAKASPKKKK